MSVTGRTWTAERIAQLKSCFAAGLSCSQIADEIGVSRNAVIGKINRLRLTRLTGTVAARPRRPRVALRLVTQHDILSALRAEPEPPREEIAIPQECRCSLADLSDGKCRWPISEPGSRDFGFCGGKAVDGLPYCAAHARIAYQPAAGQRSARR
jgi:GcrA cell cycle regulator